METLAADRARILERGDCRGPKEKTSKRKKTSCWMKKHSSRSPVIAEVVGRCRRSRSLPDWIAFVTPDWSVLVAAAVGCCRRNGSREFRREAAQAGVVIVGRLGFG
jgi:hypothetical protein